SRSAVGRIAADLGAASGRPRNLPPITRISPSPRNGVPATQASRGAPRGEGRGARSAPKGEGQFSDVASRPASLACVAPVIPARPALRRTLLARGADPLDRHAAAFAVLEEPAPDFFWLARSSSGALPPPLRGGVGVTPPRARGGDPGEGGRLIRPSLFPHRRGEIRARRLRDARAELLAQHAGLHFLDRVRGKLAQLERAE